MYPQCDLELIRREEAARTDHQRTNVNERGKSTMLSKRPTTKQTVKNRRVERGDRNSPRMRPVAKAQEDITRTDKATKPSPLALSLSIPIPIPASAN